jgi:hypothetical protein
VALPASIAAAGATVSLDAAGTGESLAARLARLQDENAIRALNLEYARHVNAGTRDELALLFIDPANVQLAADVRRVAPLGFGDQDRVDIAADRQTASASLHVSLGAETPLDPDCTLVQMARQQGNGIVERTDLGVFENTYVKRDGVWKIQSSTFRPLV